MTVMFTPSLDIPVTTIPWDRSGSYFQRVVRWMKYTRRWRFYRNWYFCLFNEEWVKIPKGFEFDGASIPKGFRFMLSPTGVLFAASCLHDYGYRHDKLIGIKAKPLSDGFYLVRREFDYHPRAGKQYWDWLFKQVARQVTGLRLIPNVVYASLLLFGSFAWKKYRKKEGSENYEKIIA